jgi:hypothetical protein
LLDHGQHCSDVYSRRRKQLRFLLNGQKEEFHLSGKIFKF